MKKESYDTQKLRFFYDPKSIEKASFGQDLPTENVKIKIRMFMARIISFSLHEKLMQLRTEIIVFSGIIDSERSVNNK